MTKTDFLMMGGYILFIVYVMGHVLKNGILVALFIKINCFKLYWSLFI